MMGLNGKRPDPSLRPLKSGKNRTALRATRRSEREKPLTWVDIAHAMIGGFPQQTACGRCFYQNSLYLAPCKDNPDSHEYYQPLPVPSGG